MFVHLQYAKLTYLGKWWVLLCNCGTSNPPYTIHTAVRTGIVSDSCCLVPSLFFLPPPAPIACVFCFLARFLCFALAVRDGHGRYGPRADRHLQGGVRLKQHIDHEKLSAAAVFFCCVEKKKMSLPSLPPVRRKGG